MFPLEIKLKTRLFYIDLESDNYLEILEFYKNEFIKRKADNVRIENNQVRFNNKFFKFINNWNIMVPVDKGILTIGKDLRNELVIEYLFSLKVTLILGGIAGVLFFLFSKMWVVGVGAFLWLGVMNWLIAVIRHSLMFSNLNNELINRILNNDSTT